MRLSSWTSPRRDDKEQLVGLGRTPDKGFLFAGLGRTPDKGFLLAGFGSKTALFWQDLERRPSTLIQILGILTPSAI